MSSRRIPFWRRWALHTLPELPHWTQGRVALLGDAAHPMLPYLAQGGAFALEDALVLAGCLRDAESIPDALGKYASLRRPRAQRAQAASLPPGQPLPAGAAALPMLAMPCCGSCPAPC